MVQNLSNSVGSTDGLKDGTLVGDNVGSKLGVEKVMWMALRKELSWEITSV